MKLLCVCGKELVARRHQNAVDVLIEPCFDCRKVAFSRGQEDGAEFRGQMELNHIKGQEMGL